MKTELREALVSLKDEFSKAIVIHQQWRGKSVKEFFLTYRPLVSALLRKYPKFMYKGVSVLAGMIDGEMPFEKELIQARILKLILNEDSVVLLPRFFHRFLNDVFGIELEDGSLADCVIFFPRNEWYAEFKICHQQNIGANLNEIKNNPDVVFMVLDDANINNSDKFAEHLAKRSLRWNISKNTEIIICDMNGRGCWKLKKEAQPENLPLFDSSAATSTLVPGRRLRIDELNSPTVLLLYLDELKTVNNNDVIHYPEYFVAENEIYRVEANEHLLLYGGSLDSSKCRREYRDLSRKLARIGRRALNPANVNQLYDEGEIWFKLVTAVVEFESETKTVLYPDISARGLAEKLGIEYYNIHEILP